MGWSAATVMSARQLGSKNGRGPLVVTGADVSIVTAKAAKSKE